MRRAWWMQFFSPDEGGNAGGSGGDAGAGNSNGQGSGEGSGTGGSGAKSNGQQDQQSVPLSEVDRRISEARKKWESESEAKLAAERKRLDEEKLRQDQKFKELADLKERELSELKLRDGTRTALAAKGLSDLAPVFDLDVSTLDGRTAAAEVLNKQINDLVEKRVAERLKSPPAAKGSPDAARAEENKTKSLTQLYKEDPAAYEAEVKRRSSEQKFIRK